MKIPVRYAITLLLWCALASGQTYKILWSFGGAPNDGAGPLSSLVFDRAGNLYGTTLAGGLNNGGTVFALSPNSDGTWAESVLYSFCMKKKNLLCLDGSNPAAGLVIDRVGSLFGTTENGGTENCPFFTGGCGTVFKLIPPSSPGGTWTGKLLYNFCAVGRCLDGYFPTSQLTRDAAGNIYGTTSGGGTGTGGLGTVFELSPGSGKWTLTTLYNFCANGHNRICPDGAEPQAGVVLDKLGNLYGTTEIGGAVGSSGAGTIYELSPTVNGWTETVLLSFPGTTGLPLGIVSFDPAGNLYTTASSGGGGVFELKPRAHSERAFIFNGADQGATPSAGVLIDPKTKAVYGTTANGGSGKGGTVFKLTSSNQETVLYNFCQQTDCTDGMGPLSSLVRDAAGNLYGTTKLGGANGLGVVFEITP